MRSREHENYHNNTINNVLRWYREYSRISNNALREYKICSRTTDNTLQRLLRMLPDLPCQSCAPRTPSRSEPDRLRMTLGEQKPSKINENEGFRLQLACCAPGLTTPGSACRKVRGSLGGFTHVPGIEQQIMTKMHRIPTKYKRISSGRAERTQGDGQRQRSFTEKTNRNHA